MQYLNNYLQEAMFIASESYSGSAYLVSLSQSMDACGDEETDDTYDLVIGNGMDPIRALAA